MAKPKKAERPATNCQACGSSDRAELGVTSTQVIDGRKLEWVRMRCTCCQQVRIDRFELPK